MELAVTCCWPKSVSGMGIEGASDRSGFWQGAVGGGIGATALSVASCKI